MRTALLAGLLVLGLGSSTFASNILTVRGGFIEGAKGTMAVGMAQEKGDTRMGVAVDYEHKKDWTRVSLGASYVKYLFPARAITPIGGVAFNLSMADDTRIYSYLGIGVHVRGAKGWAIEVLPYIETSTQKTGISIASLLYL